MKLIFATIGFTVVMGLAYVGVKALVSHIADTSIKAISTLIFGPVQPMRQVNDAK